MNKPKPIQRFFLFCSGASKEVLYQCSTEWNKYASIGATVFLTACLASLSGGFAFHLIFEDITVVCLLGLIWAVVIFNLDRYIVLSLRKDNIPSGKDILQEPDTAKQEILKQERKRMLRRQWYTASPRFIIALIIAVTVSKPIELRMFEGRINKQFAEDIKNAEANFDSAESKTIKNLTNQLSEVNTTSQKNIESLTTSDKSYNDLKQEISQLEKDINKADTDIVTNNVTIERNRHLVTLSRPPVNPVTHKEQTTTYTKWVDDNGIPARLRTRNKEILDKKATQNEELLRKQKIERRQDSLLRRDKEETIKRYESSKANVDSMIQSLNRTQTQRRQEWISAHEKSKDLPAQLEALSQISPWFSAIWWASFVLTLLFIVLETAPVVMKLLTKRGPYDEILDAIEHEHYINQQEKISRWHSKINELLLKAHDAAKLEGKMFLKIEEQRQNLELQNNGKILNEIALKQEALAKMAIDKWYKDELSKMNPGTQPATTSPPPKLEDIFWRQQGTPDKIEFFFRDGTSNELLHIKNDQLSRGSWHFNSSNNEVTMQLTNVATKYDIVNLDLNTLHLKDVGTGMILEFGKA